MNSGKFILLILFFACSLEERVWDNPYDPNSDRTLWTPSDLSVEQIEDEQIKLSWVRNGLDFDGFIVDKRTGEEEDWSSVILLNDSTLSYIDTIDLKILVMNPGVYYYRLTAFAGEFYSNKIIVNITPRVPGAPAAVNVESVKYDSAEMVITWGLSQETDFKQYLLYHGIGESGELSLMDSIQNINQNSDTLYTGLFDPTLENWYWIGVEDTTSLITRGLGQGHAIDELPAAVILDSISYSSGSFDLNWGKSTDSDFKAYIIEEIILNDTSTIQTFLSVADTTYKINTEEDEGHYYRLGVQDIWGQTSYTSILEATSFQTIIAQKDLTSQGADLILRKKMVVDTYFDDKILSYEAYYPRWIQGGRKIFAYKADAICLTMNANGDSLYVFGKDANIGNPQNIDFSADGTKIVFSTDRGGLYTLDLENDILNPVHLDSEIINNEIYGEPEFIEVDSESRILYWKTDHQSNNNQGIKNIYTMNEDGNNIVQITAAVNFEKFTSGRLSPDGTKLLYVLEGSGMFWADLPASGQFINNNNGNLIENTILPETSQYFKNLRWSPDGEQVLYWYEEQIYVFKADGSAPVFIEPGHFSGWNDQSDKIIFQTTDNDGQMFIMNSDGTGIISLFNGPWAQLQPRQ